MKNRTYIFLSALVMVLFPWLGVKFVQGTSGMGLAMILFFLVDPILSLLIGLWAGKSARERWYLPAVNAALFMAGVWLSYDWGEPDFLFYAVIYLIIGYGAMLIRMFLKAIFQKK